MDIISGEGCKVKSWFIFKAVENINNSIIVTLPITQKIIQKTSIGFVDDTNFYSNGSEAQSKIQSIIDKYSKLHGATGGRLEQ